MDEDEAKKLAWALPTRRWGKDGGLAHHGMPLASSAEYGSYVSFDEVCEATVEKVPLAELRAVQGSVSRKGLVGYLLRDGKAEAGREDASGYPRDLPIVVEERGRYYVHDGHHRVVANRLLGKAEVEARVVRIKRCALKAWAHGPAGRSEKAR